MRWSITGYGVFAIVYALLLFNFPGWTSLVTLVMLAIGFLFYYQNEKNKRAAAQAKADADLLAANAEIEERNKKEAAQREQVNREVLAKDAAETLRYFHDTVLAPCLVIDSNIWMNEDYNDFFHVLRRSAIEQSTQLVLYGPQFDEICNIKKTVGYEGKKNRRARIAINRIEAFQKDDLLRIEPLAINPDNTAHADPLIIRLLVAEAKTAKTSLCFVSDDKELRIRVREHLRRVALNRFTIVEMDSLLRNCANIIKAENLELIPQVV